ncbi:MAG: sarcosine oxidase subunit gamma [Alphaproteobacteria bacterium]
MANVYLDGTLSIDREDYPELIQLTAWKGQEASLSKFVKAKLDIRLADAGNSSAYDDVTCMSIGPNRWLVAGEGVMELAEGFDESLGTYLDLSSARTLFRLRGDNLPWLLNKGTAVDFTKAVDGACIMTTIDHVGVLLHKIAVDAYNLYVFSSFSDTIARWLHVSSADQRYES